MIQTRLIHPDPIDWNMLTQASDIDCEAFKEDGTSVFNMALFARCHAVYCLVDANNKAIGEAVVFRNTNDDGAVIYGFAVEKAHRGQGYGSLMMKQVLESCKKAGIKFIELTMNPENIAAKRVYMDKNGFDKITDLPPHPVKKEPRWLMRKQFAD